MKAIVFDRHPGMPVRVPPAIEMIADSATVAAGRPMFLPDFADSWVARLYVAYRISRLGKDIAAKFATRYYDSFSLALRLVPAGMEAAIRRESLCGGVLGVFDYCLGFGEWRPVPRPGAQVEIVCGDLSASLSAEDIAPDTAVSVLSSFSTLKTGDVVMPCALPALISVKAGDNIAATVDGTPCLDFRIR